MIRIILFAGAALRLTRFVVLDDLGHWVIKGPAQRWASRAEIARLALADRDAVLATDEVWMAEQTPAVRRSVRRNAAALARVEDEPLTWRMKAVHGLDCPYCVGTWLSIAAMLTASAVKGRRIEPLVLAVATGLTVSYINGHIIEALDEKE